MQLFVSGPCSLWIAGFNEQPRGLGFCEQAPEIHIDEMLENVACDVTGKAPLDKVVAGESGRISGTLVQLNWPSVRSIQNRASSRIGSVPGGYTPGQLGTLVQTEGAAFTLWVLFMSAGKAVFQNATTGPFAGGPMPKGYRFPVCTLAPETIVPSSTKATKLQIAIDAMQQWDPTAYVQGVGYGKLTLYDNDMSAVASLVPA
jgi:hypothetical protein